MSDLGALLKKAREQRGLSLDDIQDLTKIRKRYLDAIEEGDYSVLPGSFYVRAFVKNYAEAVGLDVEEVLRLYSKEIPSSVPDQVIEPIQRPRRTNNHTQSSDRLSRWGFRALMWSFLLLIIVLVYVFAIKQPNRENVNSADETKMTDHTKPPVTNPADSNPVKNGNQGTTTNGETNGAGTGADTPVEPLDPPQQETTPTATTITLDRSTATTDYYNLSTGGSHKIELKSSGHAWVGIYQTNPQGKKGKLLFEQTMEDGQTASLDAEGILLLSLGRVDFVEVTVDGVLIDDGNKVGSTRKIQLTPVEASTTNGQ